MGAIGALGGSAMAMKGVIATGTILKAAGLATLIGNPIAAVAAVGLATGAGGVLGQLLGAHGKDIAKGTKEFGKIAYKGTKKAFGYIRQQTRKMNNISFSNIKNSHHNPQELQQKSEKISAATKKFNAMVKDVRKEFKDGKDIKQKLNNLHQYRIPSQQSQQKLQNLTADYHIFQSAQKNKDGTIDRKYIKQEYKKLAKEHNWGRIRLKNELAAVERRIEHHKDNLNIKENEQVDKSLLVKLANAKAKSKTKQQKFTEAVNNVGKPAASAQKQQMKETMQTQQQYSR
jgi:hypothetical protein